MDPWSSYPPWVVGEMASLAARRGVLIPSPHRRLAVVSSSGGFGGWRWCVGGGFSSASSQRLFSSRLSRCEDEVFPSAIYAVDDLISPAQEERGGSGGGMYPSLASSLVGSRILRDLSKILEKFAENFKGKISRMIKLVARNGSICDVAVKTCADKIIFNDGWEEFVKKHDLRMGDFLVFRYNGDSQFKVEIFDPTGCEKASSCVSMNSPRPTEAVKSSYEHHSRRSLDNTLETNSSSAPSSEQPGDASSSQDDFTANNVPPYMIRSNASLTPAQKHKMKEIVKDINSDISILVTVMSKSHVIKNRCGFEFLKKYADLYLPQGKNRVLLQRHGESWKMWLSAANSRNRLINGWRQFVEDNVLQIGDVCLFNMVSNKETCIMNVHVIRAMKRHRQ